MIVSVQNAFAQRSGTRQGCSLLTLHYIVLEVLGSVIRQDKESTCIQFEMK